MTYKDLGKLLLVVGSGPGEQPGTTQLARLKLMFGY